MGEHFWPCESLNGAWKTGSHSRARGGCHVSTLFPGWGVTVIPCFTPKINNKKNLFSRYSFVYPFNTCLFECNVHFILFTWIEHINCFGKFLLFMIEFIDNAEVKTKIQHEKIRKSIVFSYDGGIKGSRTLSIEKLWYDKKASGWKCLFKRVDINIAS